MSGEAEKLEVNADAVKNRGWDKRHKKKTASSETIEKLTIGPEKENLEIEAEISAEYFDNMFRIEEEDVAMVKSGSESNTISDN